MQQDVLLLRSYRQVQHQRFEQSSQRHRHGRVRGGAHQPSERKWNEPWVPGASSDRVDVRTGTGGPHLLLRQTRGARGRGDQARWKHPFTCIVTRPTGCGKSTFCDDRSTPERITWQELYATMDLAAVRFEEGLPNASMFDSTMRNLIVKDDLMAETDERVTTMFTKKVITGTSP